MEFFQYRGTVRGLGMALRLVLDPCVDDTLFSTDPSNAKLPSAIRLVESFRTRRTPAVLFGDPTGQSGLRRVTPALRWTPTEGAPALHQRYRDFLKSKGVAVTPATEFPIRQPPQQADLWRSFAQTALGFVPAATEADLASWRAFLARRYRILDAFNQAYPTPYTDFTMPLPDTLPAASSPLVDWYQFESVVLAMQRAAHRFTVLLPAPVGDRADGQEHRRRWELAKRLIELEKPAHTVFDVKFYWAMFRLGEVRLGLDTVIDRGSRAPQLRPPLVLGQGYLSEGFLASGFPRDAADRQILDRDPLPEGLRTGGPA
jgi:hypothetical protein